jgi:HTH-type transcriptional regulator, sugar sensing transcriptional regulator
MTTVELLQQIGLNKYEAEAYYTLLTRGALTGYEVGKFSQVPGSRSYEVLERLIEKGLAFVQPGDPPRYSAQNPQDVFARFRSTMETTLNTLATSLASLARVDTTGEFWIVRGQQNVLAQAKSMITGAQASLDLVLPAQYYPTEQIAARNRGVRIFHFPTEILDQHTLLLLCDGREALVGTLTPADSCQAVLSSNMALLNALHGYFLYQQTARRPIPEAPIAFPQPNNVKSHDVDWMDWEARKQNHLLNVSTNNRTA